MYRVIIVDDEPWTLQGICETFEWEKYNLDVIGAYTSATRAMQEILEKKPDVVFTDIRMPIINGIELLASIRKNGLDTEVIIISGFGQFDYAQQAIKEGAFDYVLKPIDKDATGLLLERLQSKLELKSEDKNRKIIEMILEEPEVIVPEQYGIPNKHQNYQVVIWDGQNSREFHDWLKQEKEIDFTDITISNQKCYIINYPHDLSEMIKQQKFTEAIGISRISNSASDIPKLITQASVAVASVFITKQPGSYLYKVKQSQNLMPLITRITSILDGERLIEFSQLVGKMPQIFRENQYTVEDLSFCWNRIIVHVEQILRNKFDNIELELFDWQQFITKYDGMDCMCQALINEVQYCYSSDDFETGDNFDDGSSTISKIIKYINHHYGEQLKLKEISQMFYINKNYGCFLFKRYTGMTYSEYLNKVRMQHAKEMLASTSYTISEISDKAGYTDYFYFSKLFKKMYGMTPTKYRQQPIDNGDKLVSMGG
jgi:YesN/AraC family two-component response regulator